MQLRAYQTNLINNTRNSFISNKRVLSVAPCGAGKTFMFAYMCSQHLNLHKTGYVWFLVHRQELIDQTISTFETANISRDRVLIGMVSTVSRHLDRYQKPTMIVFDEAHHATANTWKKILDTYPDVPLIGLTATPCRLDGSPLGSIFQDLVNSVSTKWLIDHNYLSHYKYYAPNLDLEESKWQIKGSDYDPESVASTLDKEKIYGDILQYLDLSKKTIIYAPNIDYSLKLAAKIGPLCRHFDGNTPEKERKQIISDFREGKIRVLTNVNLIGEGFDVPDCDCCMLLRPTMSTALYIQQSMRCMRYQPNKSAVIYDFVGNVFKHGLPDEDREWSLNTSLKIRNKTNDKELLVRTCKSCFRVYAGSSPICPYCETDNGKTKTQLEEDHKKELQEIKELERKKLRKEVGMTRTYEALVELGKKRGYRNPVYWANCIMKSRNSNSNSI